MFKRGFVFGVLILFLINYASASAIVNSSAVKLTYSGGDKISGNITVRFADEPIDSLVTSNFPGGVSVYDFVKASGYRNGYEFNCTSRNCVQDYGFSDNNLLNSVSINGQTVIGIKIAGDDSSSVSLTAINMTVSNNLSSSCDLPLGVDFLANGMNNMTSLNYVDGSCYPADYGCFNSSYPAEAYSSAIIMDDPAYCEKINLKAAPAYRIGARIKNSTNGQSGDIIMELIDSDMNSRSCKLSRLTSNEEIQDCIVNYSASAPKEVLVCVRAAEGSNTQYSVKTESFEDKCGTDNGGSSFPRDYEIYATPLMYGPANFIINDASYLNVFGDSLTSKVNEFIQSHYSGICNPYCLIPIRIFGVPQMLSINNIKINYNLGNSRFSGESGFYKTNTPIVKINSGNLFLSLLNANFTVPTLSEEKSFNLSINGVQKLSVGINITKGFDFDVQPRFFLIGILSNLYIFSSDNITSSQWTFNGSVENAQGVLINHRFLERGNQTITVKAKKASGTEITKSFDIVVGNANESAKRLINEAETRLRNITIQIEGYSPFLAAEIKKEMGFDSINKNFTDLKSDYASSVTDQDYINVVSGLLNLNIPFMVYSSSNVESPLIAFVDGIDTGHIAKISGNSGEIDSSAVKTAISAWNFKNYNANAKYKKISLLRDSGKTDLLAYVELSVSQKSEVNNPVYLVIAYPKEEILFGDNYNAIALESGATSITLSNAAQNFAFIVPASLSLSQLGMYVSPELKNLDVSASSLEGVQKPIFKTLWFSIGILIILIATLIVYVMLQEWYKNHYESKLFKNRDDLYNLINFIYNARVSGLADSEIKKKLSANKWHGEQVHYAFRKIDGKRTGMFEIPIFKGKENKRVYNELAKRQGGMVDARFIKQSRP